MTGRANHPPPLHSELGLWPVHTFGPCFKDILYVVQVLTVQLDLA